MSNDTLWENSLRGANYEKITEFATEVPKILSDASNADADNVTREAGLLLTKKQIIDLRRYEAAGLALPYTLKDVTDYLRFGAGQDGGDGLRAADFLKTFAETRDHARRWSPLRERIMITGTELKLFGASMQRYGEDMEEVYLDLKSGPLLEQYNVKTVEQLKKLQLELGDKFPGIELDADTIPDMKFYLGKIFDRVASNLVSVRGIKTDLDKFGYDLREKVLPGIKLRVALIQTNSYPAEVKKLDEVIARRAEEILEKNTQYQALVDKALGSAAGLNLFGLGMAIYYGVEAEAVRAVRKELNAAQDKDIEVLRNMNQTLGSLKRVEQDLQNLTVIAIDADLATQNLIHVWNVMHRYVDESSNAMLGITDALSLRRFMSSFREVVGPWVQIHNDADLLIEVFKEADREYNQDQGRAVPRMTTFSIKQNYPEPNLQVLKDSHHAMRDDAVAAEALFIRLNYLPGVFDRFQRLLGDVGAAARDLRESSLNSKMDLESKVRKLVALEKELTGAVEGSEEFDEIEEDLIAALKKMLAITRSEASKVSIRLANISDGYDRRTTLGYIAGLEKDQLDAKESKQALSETQLKLQRELKVLSEAISAIEKAGIEKIGKDIALTIDKLKELGMAPPQAQIVMFAIDELKKAMADINAGITFINMIHESNKLQDKVNELGRKIALKDRDIDQSVGKIEFIHLIHALDDQRQRYVGEYKLAVAAFKQFLTVMEGDTAGDVATRSARAIKEASQFIGFLTPISRP
ncbi:alpha-xenorhabdolysin family binary toxin subunit A [Pseudomonas sp. MM213]|uniref:alpha-xenorhabdolysin family binary toxin subunit A n=1 Tax=Pseudomonas sp. MM213 TaxID=2866807 RepID=UPI001CF484C5|nr:alpha-xenorhabdolysin family binary toxin subunit A [Pseudomonas sp. MM213]UCP09054.1 alpha-xenorhabdolysin family binary toxin subunit A [Pseudomonas sp. MM213]